MVKTTDKANSKINEMKQTDKNKVKAGAAGGIDAAVQAINKHIDNANVCQFGCGALCNMTANCKNN